MAQESSVSQDSAEPVLKPKFSDSKTCIPFIMQQCFPKRETEAHSKQDWNVKEGERSSMCRRDALPCCGLAPPGSSHVVPGRGGPSVGQPGPKEACSLASAPPGCPQPARPSANARRGCLGDLQCLILHSAHKEPSP